jgi:hypothetical protein
MAQNIRAWIDAFSSENITVKDIRFVANFAVTSKVSFHSNSNVLVFQIRETSQYSKALRDVFNYTPTEIETQKNAVRMNLELKNVPCRIGLHFSDPSSSLGDQDFCPPTDRSSERIPQSTYSCLEKIKSHNWYRSVWGQKTFGW